VLSSHKSFNEDNPSSSEDKSSKRRKQLSEDDMADILGKVESVIGHSFNVPISFRLELYYMQAKVAK
jgi:hypothetical protein